MFLRPGQNVWRVAQADRAAVLLDGAAYFQAVRQALLKARRSVFVVGWDIHSQTRLVGDSGRADDGYPERFGELLSALVRERPELNVCMLLWDYSVLYATERELFPTLTLRWNMPERVHFCLDDAVPLGSSQHQKLIVIDDTLAFSGGLDVTIRRWDTTAHRLDDPLRVDTAGKPYRPFHDVQALVDGNAARALAELARARWARAAGEPVPPIAPYGDPWPDDVAVDFRRVAVGVARTQPFYEEQREVREVERLYLDMIDSAEQAIYIENQFLTSTKVAHRLARRLQARPALEALIVCPKGHDAWLESHSMRYGRIRFQQVLRDAGVGGRVRLVYPSVTNGERAIDTMVHSKLMIVDDRILRIGSANLNNRSMGTDTECDLAIVAGTDEERRQIARIRARLLGDHCGVSANEAAAAVAANASLLTTAERLGAHGHRLLPIQDGEPDLQELSAFLQSVADPERPIGAEEFVSQMFGGHVRPRQVSTVLRLVAVTVVVLALTLVWHYTPLAGVANPERIREALAAFADGPWGPVVTVAAFVVGGLVAFPVTILIAATAAAFGPWAGCAYAAVGALTSAVVTYGLGAWLGKESLRKVLGPKLNRVRHKIARQGVIAIAAARMVPIAPFTVVNLVAGASEIRFVDYVFGTALGLVPGLLVLSALGHQVTRILVHPTVTDYALLVCAVMLWVALSIGLQMLVSRLWSARS